MSVVALGLYVAISMNLTSERIVGVTIILWMSAVLFMKQRYKISLPHIGQRLLHEQRVRNVKHVTWLRGGNSWVFPHLGSWNLPGVIFEGNHLGWLRPLPMSLHSLGWWYIVRYMLQTVFESDNRTSDVIFFLTILCVLSFPSVQNETYSRICIQHVVYRQSGVFSQWHTYCLSIIH